MGEESLFLIVSGIAMMAYSILEYTVPYAWILFALGLGVGLIGLFDFFDML
jgi:hypothetical protein